jgi:hypothetical protein
MSETPYLWQLNFSGKTSTMVNIVSQSSGARRDITMPVPDRNSNQYFAID